MIIKGFRRIYRSNEQTASPQLLDESSRYGPMINPDSCDDCGECARACPVGAISTPVTGIDLGACIYCRECLDGCPKDAISWESEVTHSYDRASLNASLPSIDVPDMNAAFHPFRRSLAIRVVDAGSCNGCTLEANSLSNPIYDLERFGIRVVASPRHADALLVCGPVTENMREPLMRTYEAMPSPKIVIAMGACAISGGVFKESSSCGGSLSAIIPVDIFIPGCPPSAARLASVLSKTFG